MNIRNFKGSEAHNDILFIVEETKVTIVDISEIFVLKKLKTLAVIEGEITQKYTDDWYDIVIG